MRIGGGTRNPSPSAGRASSLLFGRSFHARGRDGAADSWKPTPAAVEQVCEVNRFDRLRGLPPDSRHERLAGRAGWLAPTRLLGLRSLPDCEQPDVQQSPSACLSPSTSSVKSQYAAPPVEAAFLTLETRSKTLPHHARLCPPSIADVKNLTTTGRHDRAGSSGTARCALQHGLYYLQRAPQRWTTSHPPQRSSSP